MISMLHSVPVPSLTQARGKKRQIGWFPANYVKLLSPSTNKTTPTEPIPPKPPVPSAGMAWQALSPV